MLRAINENMDVLSVVEVVAQQLLDLRHRNLKLARILSRACYTEQVKLKRPKYTQTEVFAFSGNPKSVPDAIAYDKIRKQVVGVVTR